MIWPLVNSYITAPEIKDSSIDNQESDDNEFSRRKFDKVFEKEILAWFQGLELKLKPDQYFKKLCRVRYLLIEDNKKFQGIHDAAIDFSKLMLKKNKPPTIPKFCSNIKFFQAVFHENRKNEKDNDCKNL